MGFDGQTALGDLVRRQFKEKKLRCEIETEAGRDPYLVFYVLAGERHDDEKYRAMGQLFLDIPTLEPMGMPSEPGNPRSRLDRELNRRKLAQGIKITDIHGGYDDESKHYVICVHFPEWQMEGAQRIVRSFGKGIG